MNQVEQSVAEYVDEVWEDVVADIEQLVSYPSVAVSADAEPGAPFGRRSVTRSTVRSASRRSLAIRRATTRAMWALPISLAAATSSSRPSATWTWCPPARAGTPTRLRWSVARAGCSAAALSTTRVRRCCHSTPAPICSSTALPRAILSARCWAAMRKWACPTFTIIWRTTQTPTFCLRPMPSFRSAMPRRASLGRRS